MREYPQSLNCEMPIDLVIKGKQIYVVLLKAEKQYYNEPFFIDTLAFRFNLLKKDSQHNGEENMLVRPLHFDHKDPRIKLIEANKFIAKSYNYLPKKKIFIFHVSRCGSTLITQIFCRSKKFFPISEPPIINKILDPKNKIPFEVRKKLLAASIETISNCAPLEAEFTVIKFRSWNILFINQILASFKETPWLFVHRNGAEVLASVIKAPPGWLRSKNSYAAFFAKKMKIASVTVKKQADDEFTARIVGVFCNIANKYISLKKHYLDYKDLPDKLFTLIGSKFEISLTKEEKNKMLKCVSIYSKDITKRKIFAPDLEIKNKQITKVQKSMIKEFVEKERHLCK